MALTMAERPQKLVAVQSETILGREGRKHLQPAGGARSLRMDPEAAVVRRAPSARDPHPTCSPDHQVPVRE